MRLLLENATICDPKKDQTYEGNLAIKDGVICCGDNGMVFDRVIDCTGLLLTPGLVDIHVHLRDPGQTYKEDIYSGCCSAAAGGVTTVVAMPNTVPAVDSCDVLQYIAEASRGAAARVFQAAAITKGLSGGEMCDYKALAAAKAAAFSDDGRPVVSDKIMESVLMAANELHIPVLSHCEDLSMATGIMNEGKISNELGVKGIPSAAEDNAVRREVALCEKTGCPVHICHLSTAGAIDIIRNAKKRGVKVTAETAPHYFSLTHECLRERNANYRMNPPLGSEEDRQAVVNGIADGTIDCIATDHAPHSEEEKSKFESAPNGAIGLETSFAAGYTHLVRCGIITINQLVRLMTTAPSTIMKLPFGTLCEGDLADIALFDLNCCRIIDKNFLHGKSKNTPFHGKRFYGKTVLTILGGNIVFEDKGDF